MSWQVWYRIQFPHFDAPIVNPDEEYLKSIGIFYAVVDASAESASSTEAWAMWNIQINRILHQAGLGRSRAKLFGSHPAPKRCVFNAGKAFTRKNERKSKLISLTVTALKSLDGAIHIMLCLGKLHSACSVWLWTLARQKGNATNGIEYAGREKSIPSILRGALHAELLCSRSDFKMLAVGKMFKTESNMLRQFDRFELIEYFPMSIISRALSSSPESQTMLLRHYCACAICDEEYYFPFSISLPLHLWVHMTISIRM